ncbi:MAG TPA: PDZ domain-containing protein [Blastocatellia bacterium]|nr:PDZ domain-containing protein [Blastocatellia bacterium]
MKKLIVLTLVVSAFLTVTSPLATHAQTQPPLLNNNAILDEGYDSASKGASGQTVLPTQNLPENSAESRTGIIRYPDVGTTQLIFVYANQLWAVPKQGGVATRLTDTSGPKSYPRLSPDEKTIAFTGAYNGIYTVPLSGGSANRITHHPGTTTVCDWSSDGRVLFMADAFMHIFDNDDQARVRHLLTVSARGGLPQKIPVPYGANGSISADDQWLAYTFYANGLTEAKKHYFGGYAPDIWLFNLRNHQSKRITDWKGTDTLPMWHGDTVYYVSDEGADGRLNIWSYNIKSGRREQITYFKEFDVKWPSIGPGSSGHGEIVLVDGLDLYLLDLATRQLRKVQVTIPADLQQKRSITVDASKFITNWRLSPEGNKSLIEARGDIWTVDNATGAGTNITRTSGVAERDPTWSPDGNWISYFSDASGEYKLHISRSDGTEARQATHIGTGFQYRPVWSPDSQRIAFYDSTASIYLHRVATGETKKIDRDPLGRFPQRSQMSWSPDSQWLAYPRGATKSKHYRSIWLYNVVEGRSQEVTSGSFNDSWPVFDSRGDYLYFVSARNFGSSNIVLDSVDHNNFVYPSVESLLVVPLRKSLGPPWVAINNINRENWKNGRINIDITDFERRAVFALRNKGQYSNLAMADRGRILFMFTPIDGATGVKELDFSKGRDAKQIVDGVETFAISSDGRKVLVRNERGPFVIDAAPQQKLENPIRLDRMTVEIDLRSEGQQIFNDAWRLYRDFFHDEKMHGVDWPARRAKYAKLAALCTRREDIYEVISEMLGELGASHLHLTPSSDEETTPEDTGMLAVDFELAEGAYRISKIYDGAPSDIRARNPLASPGVNVREGTFVLAVNGAKLDPSQDPWVAFKGLAGTDATLTVSDKPVIDDSARSVTVNLLNRWGENIIRQRAWVAANRSYVERKSGGKVGYLYLADTYLYGSVEFTRQFNDQLERKALIIDVRWNEGGLSPLHVIDVLARRPYPISSYAVRRAAGSETMPSYINEGPKCLLINGVTLSGGDELAYYFRHRGLGKLIGTTTMGAAIGTGPIRIPYVDGGWSSLPIQGYYDETGALAIEGRGIPPDITVIDDPALMLQGGDPQLDRAIQQLLSEIKERKPVPPPVRR